ncbi:MAG: DUF87 domain-containing protein [Candidatus Marsarchaeota archaeon]|nr:DUF87 domain-containing protein [Candidatus Marsarchaeota archaeon]
MGIDIGEGASLDPQLIVTGRGCVIGQSGSGKSYLVGVIVEELCKANLPFVIIDTEGEYRSLKSMFNVLWVSGEKGADVDIGVNYRKLFTESLENDVSVILDVSGELDKVDTAYKALEALYAVENERKEPFLVIIEEADKFAPQIVHPRINIVEEISVRGRKRGIGLLVATQRPANVSKNVLAQCSYGFIGKLSIDNDIKAVDILINDRKTIAKIPELETGTFIPFGLQKKEFVKVRKRLVEHVGSTPLIGERKATTKLGSVISDLKGSRELRHSISTKPAKSSSIIEGSVIVGGFTIDDAKSYAEKLLKKQFFMFGKKTEDIDFVTTKYIQAVACRLRIPTGHKREFKDSYLLLKGNEFVLTEKNLSFADTGITKPSKLDDNEIAVLSVFSIKNNARHSDIQKLGGIGDKAMDNAIKSLKRRGLVIEKEGKFHFNDRQRYLLEKYPETKAESLETDKVLNYDKGYEKNISSLVSNIFPTAQIIEMNPVYIPIYEINLRKGDRVRIFKIDGLYGNVLESI